MVATAIVDTGCSQTILNQNFLSKNQRKCLNSTKVVTFEGNVHQCIGSEIVTLEVDGIKVRNEVINKKVSDKNGVSSMEKIYSYPIGVKGLRKNNLPAKNDKKERFRIGDKVWSIIFFKSLSQSSLTNSPT